MHYDKEKKKKRKTRKREEQQRQNSSQSSRSWFQEFELLELNLIHTQAKYNSLGWKWSRTPCQRSYSSFWWHFCFSAEIKASITGQALPSSVGHRLRLIRRKGEILDLSLARGIAFGFLEVSYPIVRWTVGSHTLRWQGWITSLHGSALSLWLGIMVLYDKPPKPYVQLGLNDCSVYEQWKPHHEKMEGDLGQSCCRNVKAIIFFTLPPFPLILFGNTEGHSEQNKPTFPWLVVLPSKWSNMSTSGFQIWWNKTAGKPDTNSRWSSSIYYLKEQSRKLKPASPATRLTCLLIHIWISKMWERILGCFFLLNSV